MLNLSNWYDWKLAKTVLETIIGGLDVENIDFLAYQRKTGKRDRTLSVKKIESNSMLIIEGWRAFALLKELAIIPDISLFLKTSEHVLRKRLLSRGIYKEQKQLIYEIENIYLPAMREYDKVVKSDLDSYSLLCSDEYYCLTQCDKL